MGENEKAQKTVANRRSPSLAVAWIEAEIEELEHRRDAVRAERAAGMRRLPESWQPAELIDAEIDRRIENLSRLRDQISTSPVFLAQQKPSVLALLNASLHDQLARVKHRHCRADTSSYHPRAG